jgi:hypothetical protein
MDHHDSDTDSGTSIEDDIRPLLPLLLLTLLQRRPRSTNRRWTGQVVVDDLLNCGNPTRIHNQLRMELGTCFQLRDWLVLNTALKYSSPESSRFVSIKEKLLIFIYLASSKYGRIKPRNSRTIQSCTVYDFSVYINISYSYKAKYSK